MRACDWRCASGNPPVCRRTGLLVLARRPADRSSRLDGRAVRLADRGARGRGRGALGCHGLPLRTGPGPGRERPGWPGRRPCSVRKPWRAPRASGAPRSRTDGVAGDIPGAPAPTRPDRPAVFDRGPRERRPHQPSDRVLSRAVCKAVDHHVAAVFDRLDLPDRRALTRWVRAARKADGTSTMRPGAP